VHLKVRKSGSLRARLALLTENIRQWENDVRHPTAACLHDVCKSETGAGKNLRTL
jgi:hypothetical protein